MRLAPADGLTLAQLAETFTAGYEGYVLPMHVDAAAMRFFVDAWDLDLARSRVAYDDGPVGVALLGVRGERGWIGGLGVAPRGRRRGVGRALMEAVLDDAPPVVRLEVIEQNKPALRLYEQLGFRRVRVLEVWTLTEQVDGAAAREAAPRPLGQPGLPWQREDDSLPDGIERLETDAGAIVFRVTGPRVNVLQLRSDDADAAAALLAAARVRGDSLHYVNVPEDDPASTALRRLGGRLDLRQLELERAQMLTSESVA